MAMTEAERRKKRKEMDLDGDGNITQQERNIWKATQPDELTREDMAERFGFALDVIFANRELKELFRKAYREQWNEVKIEAELKNTDWYKRGKYWREAWVLEREGVEWEDTVATAQEVINRRATALGVTLDEKQLKRITRQYIYEGWYDGPRQSFLDNALAEKITSPTVGSEDYVAQLRSLAWDYGVNKLLDDAWYANAQQRIASGKSTFDAITAEIRDKAKSKYASLATAIDNGETTRSALKGYTSSMAELLELDESMIDIDDPTLRIAWSNQNGADGLPTTMTLFDFETYLRKDPRWRQTKNGRNTTLSAAQSFLESLGLRR